MTATATARRPQLVRPTDVRPLAERGRILYAEDIQALFGMRPDGKPRKSLRWIWAEFAPEYRVKDGKTPFWWEADALRWLDEQRENAR